MPEKDKCEIIIDIFKKMETKRQKDKIIGNLTPDVFKTLSYEKQKDVRKMLLDFYEKLK